MTAIARVLLACAIFATAPSVHAVDAKKGKAPTDAELDTILGGSEWGIPAFRGLRKGMSLDAVKKLFPAVGAINKRNVARTKVKGVPGISHYEFGFFQGKLLRAELVFHKSLRKSKPFFERLLSRVEAKWGKLKDAKRGEALKSRVATWTKMMRMDLKTGQLSANTGQLRLTADL